ncbi:CHAP domain-containing protein [Roseomonas sp. 573]|uniref:CHAP domain-containing protein n=1 Tax=Roseomonas haemaphysalidis TaxID=2768162 RepID=A0ABS3KRL6_9PROT|nr:CHAP domain-containing protein [Roseomonas haemaphysalidis]MBO1079667.1 CHAP domain-containing protein [Roseomonas haemaphysalidis]
MRFSTTALTLAVLLGTAGLVPQVADAAPTSRGGRETAKQQRAIPVEQSAALSSKPTTDKPAMRMSAAAGLAARAATYSGGPISCVPYVRQVTGMDIIGNAHTWWASAAGSYARGSRPERGAVMAFRSSGGMRLGHVAVVSRIVSAREVLIDHANWEGPGIRKGTVIRGASVVDVSDRNDWSAVRVQVGRSDEAYGRVYPTYGFIYNRPDNGQRMMTASAGGFEELAEAPASPHAAHLAEVSADLALGSARR